ncbi:MAG: ACT domain-containing protein [Anaeroplasma sp.]|uniref:ACT domain-containing protein n=1 Tax=Anaeroplasma sp. TaxID=1872523 RepID=UPI002A9176F4|nr:ACT domain-containing protein [Anaeroplasma sp.]MDY5982969.1 ACT domain-containing protein [Anaeroplasma sp.]
MKAVVSVVGKDSVGILASVATKCAEFKANIDDVNQTIIDDYFTMFMIINIDELTIEFNSFVDKIQELGKEKNLEIHCMHEDIFNLMHRI